MKRLAIAALVASVSTAGAAPLNVSVVFERQAKGLR